MRILKGVVGFVVEFLIGDDPKIAAGVALALGAGAVAVLAGASASVVTLGVVFLLAAAFATTLLIDLRAPEPSEPPDRLS